MSPTTTIQTGPDLSDEALLKRLRRAACFNVIYGHVGLTREENYFVDLDVDDDDGSIIVRAAALKPSPEQEHYLQNFLKPDGTRLNENWTNTQQTLESYITDMLLEGATLLGYGFVGGGYNGAGFHGNFKTIRTIDPTDLGYPAGGMLPDGSVALGEIAEFTFKSREDLHQALSAFERDIDKKQRDDIETRARYAANRTTSGALIG